MSDSALSGLKVLDLGRGVSAAYCASVLADFGADVVKVEKPGEGDVFRHLGLFHGETPDIETGALHLYLNANKQSITLNLNSSAGQDLLKRLIAYADVVVEDFAPGYLASLGLGYEALSGINASLVLASITCFGQTGPYRDYRGADIVALALGGLMGLTGLPDREPLKLPGYQSEYFAGLNAAAAILTALEWRDETGEGQWIDISAMECVASALEGAVLSYGYSGTLRQRSGSRHPLLYPSSVLPAGNGYLYVDAGGDMESLSRFLDIPELLDPRFSRDPRGHADEIDTLIAPKLQGRSREELFQEAQLWRLPFGLVQDMAEVLKDPQCVGREVFVESEHPDAGRCATPGTPFRTNYPDWRLSRTAPRLGEHNQAIYGGRLGLGKTKLDELREEGVI